MRSTVDMSVGPDSKGVGCLVLSLNKVRLNCKATAPAHAPMQNPLFQHLPPYLAHVLQDAGAQAAAAASPK